MSVLLRKSLNILIVDDEPQNLAQVKELLAPRQDVLFLARSGEQALKILRKTPIDVVISDWVLPGLSGIELMQQLRSSDFSGPLLIFTGSMLDAEHLQQAFNAGANDYLRKPLNHVEFNARLDKSLELYARQAELAAFSASQQKLMSLMSQQLGTEILRLSQIQELEGPGQNPSPLQLQRQESVAAMRSRFQNLMAWSRYRFALTRIEAHRFEVRQLFKSLESHFAEQAWRLRLKGGTGVQLLGNPDLLLRVLQQLVDNALRYSSGTVTLQCSSRAELLSIEVLDEGELSEGQLERLGSEQDNGLGLSICHDLLALLGTRLQARKRRQGGSNFYFELPAG
ncbi:MAG: hypothetical protein CVV27_13625 [Candidatus Melainabacteria bacterium HGW-Melainabacteria-1]|nr:MAG: hypothetical protein CVV27_13625 [Candidatus Melainabacteria bacterium HGW-Melainabacteria-1]